ncbi:MAG TPA: rod-binding protein [Polyangiaceae bacterium]|nr:rod-binding protein [Polyangiaceae bacterium]
MSVGSIDALTSQRQTADGQGPSATEVAAARKVAQQFEAIFLRKLMSGLEKSGGLGGSSTGSQVYGSMMVGALADSAAKSGGLGLADLVMKSLVPQLSAPARGAHSAVPGSGVLPSHLAKTAAPGGTSAPAAPLAATPPYRIGAATPGSGPGAPMGAASGSAIGAASGSAVGPASESASGSAIGAASGSSAAVSPDRNASLFDDPMRGVVP